VFCDQNKSGGNYGIDKAYVNSKDKTRLVSNAAAAIDNAIQVYIKNIPKSVKHIELAFFGGSFTALDIERQEELLSNAQKYLHNDVIHSIRLSTRPDYIDEEKLKLLKNFQVSTIEIGAQSFDNLVLMSAKRGHTREHIIKACELIKEYGFNLVVQLMPGLPNSSLSEAIESANETVKLKPNAVRIYPTVVIKDTELDLMYKRGEFTPLSIEEAVEICSQTVKIFDDNNIKIIRIGIHPLSSEAENNIVAGPYHHAIGFLVKSRIKRKILAELAYNFSICEDFVVLNIPQKNAEEYIGFKRENILFLEKIINKPIKVMYTKQEVPFFE